MKSAIGPGLVLAALAAGCVNSSTLQTARALDPGSQRILVGGGFYASPSVDADVSEATDSETSLALPYMELGKRCVIGLGFFGCGIGKLPEPDGTLFDDMDDPNRPRDSVPE